MKHFGIWALACALFLTSGVLAQPQQQAERPYQQATAAYQAAVALEREKKNEEALAAYQKFVAAYAKTDMADDATMKIAQLSRALNQNDAALKAYDQVLQQYPKSDQVIGALTNKAGILMAEKKYAEAGAIYEEMAAKYAGSATRESWLWSAMDAYARATDYKKAVALANGYQVADYTAGMRRAQALRAKLGYQVTLEDNAGIEETLAQLAKLPAENYIAAEANRFVVSYYIRTKQQDKAASAYLQSAKVTTYGGSESDLYNAAGQLAAAGQFPEAIAAYRTCVKSYPKGVYAVAAMGQIAAIYRDRLKDRAQEAAAMKELVAQYPASYDISAWMYRLAQSYSAQKDYAALKDVCTKMAQQYPGAPYTDSAILMHADVLRTIDKDLDGARRLYQHLVNDYDGTRAADSATVNLGRM